MFEQKSGRNCYIHYNIICTVLKFRQLCCRNLNVMPIPPLDFDILYLIVHQAYGPSHPLLYRIDSTALQSLCSVSKAFNDIATPVLYSSVTLFNRRGLLCFAATAGENPQLLRSCRPLPLPSLMGSKMETQNCPPMKS
jgi:hypothetical protein